MTICYDCNHALFSRMYGIKNIDMIINSTGGNVVYSKWYRYNKVRAIENECFNLCTMGYDANCSNDSYTFAISPNGKKIPYVKRIGQSKDNNIADNTYIYDIDFESKNSSETEEDFTINQKETENKNQDLVINIDNIWEGVIN